MEMVRQKINAVVTQMVSLTSPADENLLKTQTFPTKLKVLFIQQFNTPHHDLYFKYNTERNIYNISRKA
jgi:hypothetical protein